MNDFFEKLMAAILIDMAKAQNRSNRYSARLAKKYADDSENSNMKYFPIPNTAIKSFDFNLRFALGIFEDTIAPQLFKALQRAIAEYVNDVTFNLPNAEDSQKHRERVTLSIYETVKVAFTQGILLEHESRELTHELCEEIVAELKADPSVVLKDFPATPALASGINQVVEKGLSQVKDGVSVNDQQIKPIYDVKLLSRIPQDILCTIHASVEMRNVQWGFTGEENGSNQRMIIS